MSLKVVDAEQPEDPAHGYRDDYKKDISRYTEYSLRQQFSIVSHRWCFLEFFYIGNAQGVLNLILL